MECNLTTCRHASMLSHQSPSDPDLRVEALASLRNSLSSHRKRSKTCTRSVRSENASSNNSQITSTIVPSTQKESLRKAVLHQGIEVHSSLIKEDLPSMCLSWRRSPKLKRVSRFTSISTHSRNSEKRNIFHKIP